MKRSFKFWLFPLAILMLLLFSACSSNNANDGNNDNDNNEENNNDVKEKDNEGPSNDEIEEATIRFMTISLSPAFDDYLNNVIDNFEDENPGVTVEWIDEPMDQIEQLVLTQGATGNLPDVINLNTLFIKKLGGLGALVNLDEAASDVKDDYFAGLWKSGEVGGVNYAFPWYVTTDAMLYNTELLEKAGISTPPKTFEEAIEMTDALKEKTGAYGFPMNISIEKMLALYGVSIITEDGSEATLNTPEAEKLWTYLKEKYDDGYFPEEVITGQAEVSELYAQEKVAFWYTGPQKFRQVKELSPDVYEKSDASEALVSDENIERAAIMNIAIPQGGDNEELAVKFGAYLTNAENQLEFSKEANVLPSVKGAAEDAYFEINEDVTDPGEKGNNLAAQTLKIAIDTTIPVENASEITTVVREEFQRVLLENKDPAQALSDAESDINSLLAELD